MTRRLMSLFKQSASEWKKHNPLFMGAGISFYVILSAGPILVLLLFLAGTFLDQSQAAAEIVDQLKGVVGGRPAEAVRGIIQQVTTSSGRDITILASIPLIFFGSTMIFFQLKYALNIIFGHKNEGGSFRKNLKRYSLSFLMLIVIGFVMLLLILKNPILGIFREYLGSVIPIPWIVFRILEMTFSFTLVTFVFMMAYLILPDRKMRFSDLAGGSLVTALLFTIVQYLVGVNAENTRIDNAYGAIGSFTILILWIFYSSLVFLFGASFTKVVSDRRSVGL